MIATRYIMTTILYISLVVNVEMTVQIVQDCGENNKCEIRSCSNSRLQSQCFFRENCLGSAYRDCLCVRTGELTLHSPRSRRQMHCKACHFAHAALFHFAHSTSDFCKDIKQKLNHETMLRNKCSFTKNCLFIQCENSFLQDTMPASVVKVRITKYINATYTQRYRHRAHLICSQSPGVHVA